MKNFSFCLLERHSRLGVKLLYFDFSDIWRMQSRWIEKKNYLKIIYDLEKSSLYTPHIYVTFWCTEKIIRGIRVTHVSNNYWREYYDMPKIQKTVNEEYFMLKVKRVST